MKKQPENLFISTQQSAVEQPQLVTNPNEQFNFTVADSFKCPIYLGKKPEWVKELNKASKVLLPHEYEELKIWVENYINKYPHLSGIV